MKHLASPRFWALYQALPAEVRDLADKNFSFLKSDPRHPSLRRALATEVEDGTYWIWIGTHGDYDKIIG